LRVLVGLFLYICVGLNFVSYFYLDMTTIIHVKKINTVEINNLWGHYHFKWELNDDVNILVGMNGSGKTTIFRIIETLFNEPDDRTLGADMSDFRKKMKFAYYKTKVRIIFNDKLEVVLNENIQGEISGNRIKKISNLNTFDVPISMSRAERILKNFDNSDPRLRLRTLLEIELEEIIFRKEKQDSYTFLDYRLNKLANTFGQVEDIQNYQQKIQTFFTIINEYFESSYKEIQIDEKTNSIKFYHKKQEKDIFIHDLSAGEKQLLLIFFTVFLQDEQPSVLLLDEPEISLHIIWQQKLIDTLRVLNPNCQLIIATHSPSIFGKGWGYKRFRMKDLYGKTYEHAAHG